MSRPLILIAAGGTGGHVFPALAVADELCERGYQIEWIGSPKGIENRVVPENGIKLNLIQVAGLRGSGLMRLVFAPFMLLKALWQARVIIKHVKPALVLGMGGFASGPGCAAARFLNIPVVVHEQNAVPGLTNTLLSKVATRVLEGFESAFMSKGVKGAVFTGNPVRKAIADLPVKTATSAPLHLLIIGGSLGAVALNDMLPQAIAQISVGQRPDIWHQCGKGRQHDVSAEYTQRNLDARVTDFVDDMAAAYLWADLIVCRAGAMTVAELAIAGLPALFVPFPYAVDDHQTANAEWLAKQGAAKVLPQATLSPESLAKHIARLIEQPNTLTDMAAATRKAGRRQATQHVADICEELARG